MAGALNEPAGTREVRLAPKSDERETMDDWKRTPHEEMAELLPDYAVGALAEADMERVAAHVRACAACRAELLHLLETVAVIAAVPPRPAIKVELLARVAAQVSPVPDVAASTPLPPVGLVRPIDPVVSASTPGRRLQPTLPRPTVRWFQLTAVVAAVLTLAGLVAWLASLLTEPDGGTIRDWPPSLAHVLGGGEVAAEAAGVFYFDPAERVGLLQVSGLPPLEDDQRYQIWFISDQGEPVGAGLFLPDAAGSAEMLVRIEGSFDRYAALGVTAEPFGGSAAPTTPLVVGGSIR
jgi:anti-sigma-K factor RskA